MTQIQIENRGYPTPVVDNRQTFVEALGDNLRQLLDVRHPGPALGRMATLIAISLPVINDVVRR